jgi:hypothetical protein
MPQTLKVVVIQPHKSETAAPIRNLLRITGAVETPDERVRRVVKTIRSRCFGVLSDDDLELVLGHRTRR